MATIVIDGQSLEVEEGKNILDCALDAGIYIPHLCHHKDLNPLGSCRLCIVNVEGEDGVTTSCTLKAKEGLVVTTESDEIKRLRMLALELLLAGHPEECTGCPKYGNCELQMLIQYIGPKTGRLNMRTKGFKHEEGNPMFIHDMNRCILCGRCVRACNELRGVEVLQYKQNEMETYVGTLHDQLLKDSDCRFCGACAEVCPTGTIRDKFQLLESDRSKEEAIVSCRYACPAHTDVPRYVRFAKEGKYDEAAAVIREKVPFPKALGYVCNHLCESDCNRGQVNEAISIRNIKRYVSEKDTGKIWMEKSKQLDETGKKVCVVGGGPAGMTAAYYLRKQGHQVTLKEALPNVGGMMRYGIPAYRLPRTVIEDEARTIEDIGIKFETGAKVERPVDLLEDFDAVLMATGAHKGVRLPMEGSELDGVLLNADFLRQASLEEITGIGEKVIVLGGGNVAFDCARSAKRLGASEVHLACLESREAMPADEEEIHQAMEEGIHIHPGRTFERITGTSAVAGVDFMKVASFEFDENKRPVITKDEGSAHHIEGDTVIFAVGQRPDLVEEELGLELSRGYIKVGSGNKNTSVKGIFAAGDVIYGTNSVVMAVESGRQAASEIDRYLGGDGDISEVLAPETTIDQFIGQYKGFGHLERKEPVLVCPQDRKDSFELVDKGISDSDICGEAERCLQCDLRLHISPARTWGDYSEKKEAADR